MNDPRDREGRIITGRADDIRRRTGRGRRLMNAAITTLVVVGTGVAAIGASSLIAARNGETEVPGPPPALDVRVGRLEIQSDFELPIDLVGRVESRRDIELGFEDPGVLDVVRIEEGQRVARGEVIARLDTERLSAVRDARVAERDALEAERELAALDTGRQRRLLDARAVSRQGFDEARLGLARLEAQLARADAAVRSLDIALERTELRAPFDAVAGRVLQDDGSRLAAGEPVVRLFERDRARFRVGLPGDAARALAPGDQVEIVIDARVHAATLSRLRSDIDPVTRTRDAIFDLSPTLDVVEHEVGRLRWTRRIDTPGAWVEVSALREGIRGLWTLQIVDGEARLSSESVTIEYADATRAFVSGALVDGAHYVLEGTHRTTDGQTVVARLAD